MLPNPNSARCVFATLVLVASFMFTGCGRADEPRDRADEPAVAENTQHALLIGCTQYPNNSRIPELWGPANDVPAFANLLTQRFGFSPANIQQLVGWNDDVATRPTYTNIKSAFENLIAVAKPDSQIVVLMSGHGTQIPIPASQLTTLDPANPEYDGLDEVFLPADVKTWTDGKPENAIIDDQLGQWLDELKSRGAAVWIVFDCCHSGTMTRSVGGAERQRGVAPQVLGIPDAEMRIAAEKRRSDMENSPPAERSRGSQVNGIDSIDTVTQTADGSQTGSITAFYAAQAFETAPELPRPSDAPRTPEHYFGLLSYVLIQTFESQDESLTYRDLGRRVVSRYRSERGSRSPTPFFSGDLDREVLGQSQFPERASIVLENMGGQARVTAGEWMGLATNTILAVYPPDDRTREDSAILGYLRITKVAPNHSEIESCEYAGKAEVPITSFPDLSKCAIAFQELGDMRLKVAIETEPGATTPESESELKTALESLSAEIADLVQWVDASEGPQWRLRIVSPAIAEKHYGFKTEHPAVLLIDANVELRQDVDESAPGTEQRRRTTAARVYGPYPLHDSAKLVRRLAVDFQKLFAWQNTWRIADLASQEKTRSTGSKLELKVTRSVPGANGSSDASPPSEDAPTQLNPGDHLQVRVENHGIDDMWVTLLYLDADHGIQVWLSEALQAGAHFSDGGTVDSSSLGPEGFIVLAIPVRSEKSKPSYEFLEQDGLSVQSRAVRSATDRPLNPFERLMSAAAYGKGQHRGLRRKVDSTPQVLSWSWVTAIEN
ncbi:caspase family protein [Novipirellula sp. SH528]|uniref:caspase family protein n=1 Tax=Novipirellula sp. SH528 TaxID=3454466 RepID=UPI003F9F4E9B